mmetsp:Transcript_65587/g.183392  ORF Transcript_65587/g.183392 Transcript_65587/m.183392 type:complete len:480 (+) Transcript_65587:327-1766(+)
MRPATQTDASGRRRGMGGGACMFSGGVSDGRVVLLGAMLRAVPLVLDVLVALGAPRLNILVVDGDLLTIAPARILESAVQRDVTVDAAQGDEAMVPLGASDLELASVVDGLIAHRDVVRVVEDTARALRMTIPCVSGVAILARYADVSGEARRAWRRLDLPLVHRTMGDARPSDDLRALLANPEALGLQDPDGALPALQPRALSCGIIRRARHLHPPARVDGTVVNLHETTTIVDPDCALVAIGIATAFDGAHLSVFARQAVVPLEAIGTIPAQKLLVRHAVVGQLRCPEEQRSRGATPGSPAEARRDGDDALQALYAHVADEVLTARCLGGVTALHRVVGHVGGVRHIQAPGGAILRAMAGAHAHRSVAAHEPHFARVVHGALRRRQLAVPHGDVGDLRRRRPPCARGDLDAPRVAAQGQALQRPRLLIRPIDRVPFVVVRDAPRLLQALAAEEQLALTLAEQMGTVDTGRLARRNIR